MVQKTSHRGVRSGNTLRAFNSKYSRRYHSQACIVSRVRPELLRKLEGDATEADDKKPGVHNIAVNIALSLNKQSRWLLPSALISQIQKNDIAESGLTVSVLERHKLKGPANCVSFHSNRGAGKRIQPRNGRYFGFGFPTADGKSRRAARRERRQGMFEELRKSSKDKPAMKTREQRKKNKADKLLGKKVEVFTEQGIAKRNMDIGESEVRYEVYYPTPAYSSISHNPKYIKQDVTDAPGEGDQHEQQGKPKKQHRGKRRKRMTLKDIDDWYLPAYHSQEDYRTLTTTSSKPEQEEDLFQDDASEERNMTECLLSSLLEKAQQLQRFKGTSKLRRRKNSKTFVHHDDDKPHIVYLGESEIHPVPEKIPDSSSPASHPASPMPSEATQVSSSPASHPASPIPSDATRVLLPKEDVTVTSLKECFGRRYFEAGCKPRKFVLDVTLNVREVLRKQKGIQVNVAENTEEAVSYLICVHDGFYSDEYDVYKVLLNSRLHQGLLAVDVHTEEHEDLYRGTVMNLISQTMDFVEGLVTTLKSKNHFPAVCDNKSDKVSGRHLSSHLGSSDVYVPSVQRVFQRGSVISEVRVPSLSDLVEEGPVFCDVCYDDISPLTNGSAASTALLGCGHSVCDSCWSQHIHVRLHEGFVRLTCPGYDCQEEVKVGVLLSVTPLDTAEKLLQRQEEVRIGASQTEKWCPNDKCGRVISLLSSWSGGELQLQQDVVCACGTHVCFQCLTPAHWPASCKQAEDYRASLATAVFPDRQAEVHDDHKAEQDARFRRQLEEKKTMLVEGKHCPRCKSFVFKNGGCPQMTCRCGQLFCWYCTKPGYSHPDRVGCADERQEKMLTTTLVVHHLEINNSSEDEKKKQQSSSANRRQRMSLMERAVQHRQHRQKKQDSQAIASLAKHVAKAAAKNKDLNQLVIRTCSGVLSPSACKPKQTLADISEHSHAPGAVLDTVTGFLKNAANSKQELLEVVEYSLVLLKDLPDSLLRRRALRISEDLGAFCSFSQSIFDIWGNSDSSQGHLQEAVRAVMRLADIQGWILSALDTHVVTVRKLRSLSFPKQ